MKKKVLALLLSFAILIVLVLFFKDFTSASIFDTLAVSQSNNPAITLDAYPLDLIIDSRERDESSFNVDKSLIKVSLKQSETKRESLTIRNTGENSLDLTLDLQNLAEFIIFPKGVSVYTFKLKPGEEQTIQLTFNIAKDKEPSVYHGKIIVKADSLQKTITSIVEVKSEKLLFDIDVEVLAKNKQVSSGNNISAEIKIFNLFGRGKVDVIIEYGIKDLEGNIILSGSSTVPVETQMSFVKSLTLPFGMKPGVYMLYVKSKYVGTTSMSSDTFEVVKAPSPTFVGLSAVQLVIIAVISLILLFIVFLALRDIVVHLKEEKESLREEKEAPLKNKKFLKRLKSEKH